MAELSLADLGQRGPANGFSLSDLTNSILRNPQIQQMILQDYQQNPNDRVANSFSDLTDPFTAAAQRTRQSVQPVGGRKEGMATRVLENVVPSTLESLKDIVTLPGRAMEQGITTDEAIPWASQVGMGMVGSPMTPANALGSSAKGIRAYHGSPHDFERFDISKIGTGEGAQAYGHGLYFAENPQVADLYSRVVTKNQPSWQGTTPPAFDALPASELAKIPDELRGRLSASWQNNGDEVARNLARKMFEESRGTEYSNALHAIANTEWKPPGHRYEVNINAKPEQMLDWDKPLAQQSSQVIEGARNSIGGGGLSDQLLGKSGSAFYNDDLLRARKLSSGNQYAIGSSEASSVLRDAGIPGIKYLDQGSRPRLWNAEQMQRELDMAEQVASEAKRVGDPRFIADSEAKLAKIKAQIDSPGTSNYVLFRDDIVDILRKYGIAGVSAIPPAVLSEALSRTKPSSEGDSGP